MAEECDWITLHRVKFPSERSAGSDDYATPDLPDCWRFCPSLHLNERNLAVWHSDIWCGLAIHQTEASARRLFNDPQDQMPFLAEARETWHAIALPITHRGQVKWREKVEDNSAIRTSDADPGGPLAVVTSAGYVSHDPDQLPRIARFLQGVVAVLESYHALPGNLRAATFSGGFDGREGFTLSLWENDKAMMQAAYSDGTHRSLMDQSRDGSMFDRSSFTRLRVLDSKGSWEGDPLAEISG